MTDLTIYVGFDERDIRAYAVATRSLRHHAPVGVDIQPLLTWELRRNELFNRPTMILPNGQKLDGMEGRKQSTEFTYARFLTPVWHWHIGHSHPCAFIDPDVMCRQPLEHLLEMIDPSKEVQVVPHHHVPEPGEQGKVGGLVQQDYPRKNWSSFMVFPHPKTVCDMSLATLTNGQSRDWLHGLRWVPDDRIGFLPAEWNWLYGVEDAPADPAIVHFTLGTPDVENLPPSTDSYVAEWWGWLKKGEWP